MHKTIFEDRYVEVLKLHSNNLDQDLQLFVKLPWNYQQSKKVYPVLYCLDANIGFHLFSEMSQFYELPEAGASQQIIIVGVGYSLDADYLRGIGQWVAWRTRDLTPVHNRETEQRYNSLVQKLAKDAHVHVQTGGAGRFLQTLRDEIIPLVESDYRALPTDRGLAGYSFGGLFALYALFQSGGLFSKFLAGSPSMWASLFEDEEEYAALNTDLPAKLFLTAGSLEQDLLQPIQHMVDRLRKRAYPNLDVRNYVFEGEGHVSATAAAISRALNLLYYADHSNN